MWTPNSHYHRMSTTGSIVTWFWFWWILVPVYALYAFAWLVLVVVVNTLILVWRFACWATVHVSRSARSAV